MVFEPLDRSTPLTFTVPHSWATSIRTRALERRISVGAYLREIVMKAVEDEDRVAEPRPQEQTR